MLAVGAADLEQGVSEASHPVEVPVPPVADPAPEVRADAPAAPSQAEGFTAIESPVEAESTPGGGGDRIDDLLRQFRERYGRE